MSGCNIEGCSKPRKARGLCGMHYQRWCKYGDPLGGRTFCGEPLKFLREIVLPYKGDDCLSWPFGTTKGYGRMLFEDRERLVHEIVCEAVNGSKPDGYETSHTCGKGNKGCVNPRHLTWETPRSNQLRRVEHGTSNRGERCAAARLTEADVHEIRALKGTRLHKEIAARFGVSRIAIHDILSGRTWSWLRFAGG